MRFSELVMPLARLVAAVLASGSLLLASLSLQAAVNPVRGTGPEDDPTRQTDADWVDGRWQDTDFGSFLFGSIRTSKGMSPKGVAVRTGTLAALFDTETLQWRSVWEGGFLELGGKRYGLTETPRPKGKMLWDQSVAPAWKGPEGWEDRRPGRIGPLSRDWARYLGMAVHGDRVLHHYQVLGTEIWDSPSVVTLPDGTPAWTRQLRVAPHTAKLSHLVWHGSLPKNGGASVEGDWVHMIFQQDRHLWIRAYGPGVQWEIRREGRVELVLAPSTSWSEVNLALAFTSKPATPDGIPSPVAAWDTWLAGGPVRWSQEVVTQGRLGQETGPLQVDDLPLPENNPWGALTFASGHDFLPGGEGVVCTAHGDVWVMSGADANLQSLRWRRYASGLHQPLGLKVYQGRIHVLERDRITVLEDRDGNGEADYYRCFNNDCLGAGGGHSFTTCLELDPSGAFWFIKCGENTPHGGTLLKVAPDGSGIEVVATGFRNPNGLGMSPEGVVTAADQQGTWIPETRLDLIRPGGFYGFVPMSKRSTPPKTHEPPLCWIPRVWDNSAGGQTWVPQGSWGALEGRMLHLSYGRCRFMAILQDGSVNGQGGVVPLPGRFLSGVMRGRFSPHDGHLYLTGLRGWQTAAVKDGCLQRVRYTGRPWLAPVAYATHRDGMTVTFGQPLDRELAEDVESWSADRWNYVWSEVYGSPEFKPSSPGTEGRDPVEILSAKLLPDGRSVRLRFEILPAMVTRLQYNLDTAKGDLVRGEFPFTVHALPK